MVNLGRKNNRGKTKTPTDFSHLIDKVEEKENTEEIKSEKEE